MDVKKKWPWHSVLTYSSVTESVAHVLEADSQWNGGVVPLKCIGDKLRVIFCRA